MANIIAPRPQELLAPQIATSGKLKPSNQDKATLALELGRLALGASDKKMSSDEADVRTTMYVEALLAVHPLEVVVATIEANRLKWKWFPELATLHESCVVLRHERAKKKRAEAEAAVKKITDNRTNAQKADPRIVEGFAALLKSLSRRGD